MALDQDNLIRVTKTFNAPKGAVYETCADEDFFDFCGVDIDSGDCELAVGGAYSYVVDDDDFVKGEFREIKPNERLVFTWLTQGLDGPTGETLVTLSFSGEGARSELVLEHSGIKHRKTAKAHEEAWVEILEAIAEDLAERAKK